MRVALADDSLLVREGLKRVLAEAGIDVCAEASDAEELVAAVDRTVPDVVVADIRMPPTFSDEGVRAAAAITARHPNVAVLVLSQYVDADYALALLEDADGARGYLLKERVMQAADLLDALARLERGETVVDRELVDELLRRSRVASPIDDLTERERHVLSLMAEGLTDRGIAERLWLSPKTVETHVRHVLQKLGLPEDHTRNRRVQAVLTYLQR
ncbi:MAG TPA: response regulator transcription factor [Gaiellaceae bacterium]|nr:response regulator transcription factor [Gaiellaceae bacterium]